jgi:hypothetical protein
MLLRGLSVVGVDIRDRLEQWIGLLIKYVSLASSYVAVCSCACA